MTVPRPGGRTQWVRWIPFALAAIGFAVVLSAVFSSDPAAETSASPTTLVAVPEAVASTTTTSTTAVPITTTLAPDIALTEMGVGIVGERPESLHPFLADLENPVVAELLAATGTSAMVTDVTTLSPTPGVIVAVPSLDNGGLQYHEDGTVTLRYEIDSRATWSDGVSVSGQDFLFTAETLRDDRRIPTEVRDLYRLIDTQSWVVDPGSVEFTLSERTIDWLDLFSPLLPAHQMFETDLIDDWAQQRWVTAGLYYLANVEGNAYVLRPNVYHASADTLIQEIVVWVFPYEGALAGALDLGIVHIGRVSEPLVIERLLELDRLVLVSGPGMEWEHIAFQFGSGRFAANVGSLSAEDSFRELTAGLLNRPQLVDEFFPGSKAPISTVVGISWPEAAGAGWAEPLDEAELVDLRDDLYRELGADTSLTVAYVTTDDLARNLLASELVQAFADLEIGLQVELEEPGLFFNDTVIPGEFDVAQWAWTATPGPQGAIEDVQGRFVELPRAGGFNFYQWGSAGSDTDSDVLERFELLIADLEQEMDLERLAERLRDVDNLLAEQVVVVPLFSDLVQVGVDRRIGGFVVPVGGQPLLSGVDGWSLGDGA